MRILVAGGYGLIGSSIVSALLRAGHDVVGLGRDVAAARRRWPQAEWRERDLRSLTTTDAWIPLLTDIDVVVNAAGVLQDGPDDDVMLVQADSVIALIAACEKLGVRRFVQISAAGASVVSNTTFMTSKGLAEEALLRSTLEWRLLRPGLVLSPNAYGGSALLRALAAVPYIVPLPRTAPVRTVALDDLTAVTLAAVERRFPARIPLDVVETQSHSLETLVSGLKQAIGFPPARFVRLPRPLARFLFKLGDFAAWFGWRSPLRTTALLQMEAGIDGNPVPLSKLTRGPVKSLDQTLTTIEARIQERWFARLYLLKPLIVLALGLFWIVNALMTLADEPGLRAELMRLGAPELPARLLILASAVAGFFLGAGVLFRRSMRTAALTMIGVCALTFLAGTVLAPQLWPQPFNPFVSQWPVAVLAVVLLALRDNR